MDSSEKSSSRKGDKIDTRGTGNFSDSKSDKKQTENPAQVPLETPVSTVGADSQTDQDGKNEVAGKTIFSGSQSFLLKHGATFASRKGAESQTVSPEQQHDTIAKEIHVYDNELGDHAPKPRTPGEPPDQAGGACLQTEIQKRQILKDEIRRLEEQPEKMNSTLASLNLPAALEDFSDRQEVPQSLIDIAQKIKNMGGIKFLSKQMTDLTELLQKNKDILNECIEMIDDEEKSDQGLQEKFKDKWTRTSSDKLNQQFREENMKLLQTVEAAYDTYNSVLLKKYEKHSKIIELLSKSTNVNTEFCQWKGSDQSVTQSMSLLKDLAGGLEKFMELKACLEKATKSYTDVTIQIKSHREHISAFCDERNLDKVELMANIQKSIASQPTGPIPSTPNYHNPAASTPSQEPEPSSSDTQTASSNSPDTWIGHFSHSSDDGAQKTQPGPSTHFSGFPGPPSGGESCTREYPSVQVTENEMEEESQKHGHQQRKSAQESGKFASFTKGASSKTAADYFISMIWKSVKGTKEKKRLEAVNFYELHKWHFLLENMEQKKKIACRLAELGTGITHEIKEAVIEITFQCNTTFKFDREFDQWELECYRVVEDILLHLLIVTIGCKYEDKEVFQKFLLDKFSSAIEILVQNDSHGVCLLGDGESLVTIISEINKSKCRFSSVWETETKQEIGIRSICLKDKEIHCWKLFDVKEKLKKEFPTVKIYECFESKMLKIIGNADDVRSEEGFIRDRMWLYLYHKDKLSFDKEVIEFLSRKAVKKFLDDEIKRVGTMGTWILSFEKNSVEAYSVDDQKAKVVMKTLRESFHDYRYQIADTGKQKEKLQKIQERATHFEGLTNGKLAMHIRKTDKSGEVRILCTTDLLNNTEVVNLLDEINQGEGKGAKAADVRLEITPEYFHFIKKIEKEKIKDVDLEFEKDNTLILKGDEDSVLAVKDYIEGLKLKQSSVFLPQSLTMHQDPGKLCEEHHCLLDKMQSNPESKVWFMNNIIIMVYLGEPRKDLYVDCRAVLRVSDVDIKDKSSLSTVLKDRKVVNITIPTSFMEKGKHSAHESFNDAYTKILKFKIRSVLMPMKIDGNWSTKKLVKALVYPLTKLGSEEAITVILFSSDPNQCETANLVIQDANRKGNSMDQVSTNQPKRIEFLVEKIGITKAKVDVIVNTVHTSLNLQHGYVSKAILDAASDSQNLQDELTRKKGNKTDVEHGELFETNSYGLNCKKIFHGALKPWTAKTSKNIMQKFIIACLEKADEHKFSVLAFPAIGTGNLGFPEKAVLEIVKETVRKFENDHPNTSIRKIVFCIHANDEKKFKTFQDFFKDVDDEIESKHTLSDFTRGSGLEEIVLLGVERDVRNVVQTLNHELQRKCLESFCKQLPIEPNLEEPETQTISNRNGEESTNGKKGSTLSTEQDQDTNPKNISKIDALKEDDDTKRCKIARFTDRKELDGNPIFQRIKPRAVICPYKNDNEALVIFEKRKDAEEFSKNPFPLKVEDLEEQAVRNLEAQISDKYLSCIDDHHDLEDNLIKSSGVWIEKNGKKWILSGNLPQIELAYEFLQHRILSQKENNQGNAHGSATNLDSNAEKFIKKYIPMTANEYARFMGLIKMSDARIIENISYDTPMNCLYVCGSKSYVEHIEKLTKGVIFRVIEVTDDVFKQMKADIVDLAKTNSVLHYYETDGKLELFGMSHKAVDSAVMLLETKIADLLNPSKMKRSRNQPNLGRVQTSQSAVPFMRCTELGQKEYFLKFNFKVLLYEDDILESKVDAICCGQDPSFQSKGHIAGAIVKAHKNVGEQLKQEKVKKKEYGIGEYIPIKCNLQKGKHVLVIFVVTKSPASAKKATKKTLEGIKRCFENVLNFAEWNRIKSLALPLLGTGNKGAPINDIARIWFDSLLEFIENRRETSNLKEVHFVNKDSACLKAVQGQLEAYVAKAETALY
uniref:Uncharacterized protein LOC111135768 isoform X3 n=1 Tax=Crassostrea virginica TaxID=6565 RepID=A0A8B8EPE8_CRAVI|nr:uncharacterized protein LOC111135768 isoform X3 [Crassostrea virginica]